MSEGTAVAPATDFAPGIERGFFREYPEGSYQITRIEGTVPEFVRGSYYLNGPARFERSGMRYRNWLDGDGMVCALHFDGGGVEFANKFVRGRKYLREEEAGQPIYRAFGTAFDGDRLKRGIGTESPYNVSVFAYQDTLLAFGEQALPLALDPRTLDTLTPGRSYDFAGALNDAAPFSAHPKIDPRSGELLNFGIFFAPQQPLLVYYRLDAAGQLACRSRTPIDIPCSTHDFAASENYVLIYLSPHVLDTQGLTERGISTIDALSWEPQRGSQLLVLDRHSGEPRARVALEGRYCLHTINAFEREGRLVVDLIELERPVYDQYQEVPNMFQDVPYGQPVRMTVDVQRGQLLAREPIDYRGAPDFPHIDPRRDMRECDEFWMLGISATGRPGRKFFDRLVHCRWSQPQRPEIWQPPAGHYFGGEPVFVADPRDDRGGGAVICHVFDASGPASKFFIFAAHDIPAGPLATLHLEYPVHLGFHASFHAEAANQNAARA